MDTFETLCGQLDYDFSCFRIIVFYHGGEPFLNKNFSKMLQLLKDNGAKKVKTVTNGMLLTDKLVSEIIELGHDEIEF